MKKNIRIALFALLALLVLSSPSEYQFQQRLETDYGNTHPGATLRFNELKKMGNSQYQSYIFFSKYHYTFGTIGVHYFGIGFMIFYVGSSQNKTNKNEEINVLS